MWRFIGRFGVLLVCVLSVAPHGVVLAEAGQLPRSFGLFGGVTPRWPRADQPWAATDHETFFVAIASFRDVECVLSVRTMFAQAANPRRLMLGIVEQNEPGDPICTPDEFYECASPDFCPIDNIRRRRLASRKGKGPCFGRYVSMLLYRDEAYYMMMDSHNMFIRNWERKSIAQLRRARTTRPVISHYPNGWDKNGQSYESQGNVIVMCNGHYVDMGYIRMDGRWMSRTIEPRAQPFSAGGYLFSDARMVHDVEFDPYLDFLFDGEEILFSARMWTHGWDIFTPGESVLFHDYQRHTAIRYWDVQNKIPGNMGWHDQVHVSQRRAQKMMKVTRANTTILLVDPDTKEARVIQDFDKYTLGSRRSIYQYNDFAMTDAVYRRATDRLCTVIEHQTLAKSGM